jgi:hypothetical protein
MQSAIIIPMATEREEKEHRYTATLDEFKQMRKQMEEQTRVLEKLTTAIAGNDVGTIGLVKQYADMRLEYVALKERVGQLEETILEMQIQAKTNSRIWKIVYGLLGIVGGTVFKALIDKISKK